MARRGQNYLNNKDMLKEIHISKGNYSWYEDRKAYHQYDIIVEDTSEIRDSIPQAQQNRADRIQKEAWESNTDKKKISAKLIAGKFIRAVRIGRFSKINQYRII